MLLPRVATVLSALVLVLAIPFAAPQAAAATSVSGTIGADTTWSASGSPYLVVGDVVVAANATLTIEPGVEVRFDTTPPGARSIDVRGRLVSVGSPAAHILFTSNAALPDRNDWTSVVLNGSAGSVVEHTDFSWGSIELDVRGCSPRIANDTFLEAGQRAIDVRGRGASPVIEDNFLTTALFDQPVGILVQDASPVIRNNVLRYNYFGVFVEGGSPTIEDNEIRDGWLGVVSISATPVLRRNVIEGNGLPGYGGYGILMAFTNATLEDNTIRNNAVGVDLPYDSRQTLAGSSGNSVNGVPLETLYRYRLRDAVLRDLSLDSGRGAGFTGNATQQGLLTFYDSTNVTVVRASLRGNEALVDAENSSLRVENSTLSETRSAFLLDRFSQAVALNTTFPASSVNLSDERSALTVRNFVHVRAVSEGDRPVAGARVRLTQGGLEVANRTTGADGWARWLEGLFGVLSRPPGSQAPVLSPASNRVEVDSGSLVFHDNPRPVDLSSSHEEVFQGVSDEAPPRVTETFPSPDSIAVPLGSRVTIVFSEPMNRTATESAIRVAGYGPADFAWTDGNTTVSFGVRGADYGASVFVQVGTGATDLAGNPLPSPFVFTFEIERAPRTSDLAPVWGASLAILAAGVALVLWRSRSRAKSLGEEQGREDEKPEA